MLDGSLEDFLSVVDRTDPDLVEQETRLFQNLRRLPLESYRIDAYEIYLLPEDVDGATVTLAPRVVEQVQIKGVDTRPAGYEVRLTWAQRDGEWLISAESTATDSRVTASQAGETRPWAGAPYVVRSSGGTVLALDASARARADDLLSAVRSHLEYDARVLGMEPKYRVFVDATANGAVNRMNPVDDEEAGAVTFPALTLRRAPGLPRALAGMRIKLNPDLLDSLIDDEHVLRHELAHYLTRTIRVSPSWLREGLAEYVSHDPHEPASWSYPVSAWKQVQNAAPQGPPVSDLFGMSPTVDYTLAWCGVTYLVDEFGMSRVLAFMRSFRGSALSPLGDNELDHRLRQHFGISRRDLVAGTRAQAARLLSH